MNGLDYLHVWLSDFRDAVYRVFAIRLRPVNDAPLIGGANIPFYPDLYEDPGEFIDLLNSTLDQNDTQTDYGQLTSIVPVGFPLMDSGV